MLRILHVVATLQGDAATQQLALLCQRLPRDRFGVEVAALRGGGWLEERLRRLEVPVHMLDGQRPWSPRVWWQLGRLLRRRQPEVVHTWHHPAHWLGRLAALRCGVRRLIVGQHDRIDAQGPAARWLDRRLAEHTERIVCGSQAVYEHCLVQGMAAERLTLVPSAAPPRGDGPPPPVVATVPAGRFRIGAVVPWGPEQRIKDLIWAADLLKVARPDVHLILAGDGPLRQRLYRFRAQVRIEDRVHFLPGDHDPAELVRHFDVVWCASRAQGHSPAILAAMAAGVPVIASDVPGNRELVVHGETGYRFVPGDRAALATFTQRLLNDEGLRRRLGQAAQRRAESEFSPRRMAGQYARLYEEPRAAARHAA